MYSYIEQQNLPLKNLRSLLEKSKQIQANYAFCFSNKEVYLGIRACLFLTKLFVG